MDAGGSKRRAGGSSRPLGRKSKVSARQPSSSRNGRAVNGDAEQFSFDFPSDHKRGHQVHQAIMDAAQKHGFHGEDFFALRIALEEALINAIKHGNRLDPQKTVHVEAKVSGKRAEIVVEDQGAGFDRCNVPDPTADENLHKCSGRGILLIEAYMSEVKWDRGGRRLHMVRENHT